MVGFFGNILVVDDDEIIRLLFQKKLEEVGFDVYQAGTGAELVAALKMRSYDAILLDLCLGKEDAFDYLPIIVREHPHSAIIMMSAFGSIALAVSAMEQGAATFCAKSKDINEIVSEVTKRCRPKVVLNTVEMDPKSYGFIAESAIARQLWTKIIRIASVGTTVLLQGESGTGKEVIARSLHGLSDRKDGPFVAINCAAIPEQLLEAELFGYRKGAFTDAKLDHKGLFERCYGGTLLLDEIGDLPQKLQVKLLRVLQEQEVSPIGSSRPVKIDVRIIAATHKNLKSLTAVGEFREDLYYRIAVISLEVAPLRARIDDIIPLASHFIREFSARFGRDIRMPSVELLTRLKAYTWPGNIRELRNAIERGVVLSLDGKLALGDVLPETNDLINESAVTKDPLRFDEAKRDFERRYLRNLLTATKGNISEISRISGRYRTDVYRLLARHGIVPENYRDDNTDESAVDCGAHRENSIPV